MTAAEVATILRKARWPESINKSEGFLVSIVRSSVAKREIFVSFYSPRPHGNTTTRMLRNYAETLRSNGCNVTMLKSHLVVK